MVELGVLKREMNEFNLIILRLVDRVCQLQGPQILNYSVHISLQEKSSVVLFLLLITHSVGLLKANACIGPSPIR